MTLSLTLGDQNSSLGEYQLLFERYQKFISSYFFDGMSLTWIFRFSASGEMVPLNETELYTEDRIGLKALDMVCI